MAGSQSAHKCAVKARTAGNERGRPGRWATDCRWAPSGGHPAACRRIQLHVAAFNARSRRLASPAPARGRRASPTVKHRPGTPCTPAAHWEGQGSALQPCQRRKGWRGMRRPATLGQGPAPACNVPKNTTCLQIGDCAGHTHRDVAARHANLQAGGGRAAGLMKCAARVSRRNSLRAAMQPCSCH